jgi:cytochrome o ubiquinol oxidase subunit III
MSAVSESLSVGSEIPLSQRGPAPTRVVAGFGFWLFLLSDIIIFAALFAAYAVLSDATAGGPTGAELVAMARTNVVVLYLSMIATFVLGAIFLGMEVTEFAAMVSAGAGPSRSAFLSAFFTLVGTHGLHVTLGLAWLVVMMLQVATLGFQPMVTRRFFCFGLFWHALDIVWIGVFTIVYLGAH